MTIADISFTAIEADVWFNIQGDTMTTNNNGQYGNIPQSSTVSWDIENKTAYITHTGVRQEFDLSNKRFRNVTVYVTIAFFFDYPDANKVTLYFNNFSSSFIPISDISTSNKANLPNYTYTGTRPWTTTTPSSNTCFPAGTPIETDQGSIAINKLNPTLHTIDGKKIVAITHTILEDDSVICFSKDSIDVNVPSAQTIISRNHRVLHNGTMMKASAFCRRFKNVQAISYNKEVLYNVLLEEHATMLVNNLVCETLHPKNSIAKLYCVLDLMSHEDQNRLIKEYNLLYKKFNRKKKY